MLCGIGWTPLMCASVKGHLPIAELLVANGADVNAKNNNGKKSISRSCLVSFRVRGTLGEQKQGR